MSAEWSSGFCCAYCYEKRRPCNQCQLSDICERCKGQLSNRLRGHETVLIRRPPLYADVHFEIYKSAVPIPLTPANTIPEWSSLDSCVSGILQVKLAKDGDNIEAFRVYEFHFNSNWDDGFNCNNTRLVDGLDAMISENYTIDLPVISRTSDASRMAHLAGGYVNMLCCTAQIINGDSNPIYFLDLRNIIFSRLRALVETVLEAARHRDPGETAIPSLGVYLATFLLWHELLYFQNSLLDRKIATTIEFPHGLRRILLDWFESVNLELVTYICEGCGKYSNWQEAAGSKKPSRRKCAVFRAELALIDTTLVVSLPPKIYTPNGTGDDKYLLPQAILEDLEGIELAPHVSCPVSSITDTWEGTSEFDSGDLSPELRFTIR